MSGNVEVVRVDWRIAEHCRAVEQLTQAYAEDRWGNGQALPDAVMTQLVPAMARHPALVVLLAWIEQQPAGIATCLLSFSTFSARSVLNVHDLAVATSHRGRGVGRRLLEAVEQEARRLDCAKLSLEVRHCNRIARQLYASFGFRDVATAEDPQDATYFLSKPLETH